MHKQGGTHQEPARADNVGDPFLSTRPVMDKVSELLAIQHKEADRRDGAQGKFNERKVT